MIVVRFTIGVFFLCLAARSQDRQPSFNVDAAEIRAGEAANLTWKWQSASTGYLSCYGLLYHPKGDLLRIIPSETTDYVLILEASGVSPRILSRRVVVRGAKGSESDWPDGFVPLGAEQQFTAAPTDGLSQIADRTRRILQDDRHLVLRQFAPDSDRIGCRRLRWW
jgi:hypothetical protein